MPKLKLNLRQSFWLLISAAVIAADLWTKSIAVATLAYAQPVSVLPVLNFTLLHNRGAAFSFLNAAGGWQRWLFVAIALAVSLLLINWILRLKRHERWLSIALALILGGALGNLYDRVTLGYVVDFIHAHWGNSYFPAFNLADSAITVGAIMVLIDAFFLDKRRRMPGGEKRWM
ncbi:signal peptidase II [Saccharospirillum mangrovi]|uniref:signal peptidase II n=1 Tax=Saccharospirillum mangrovi TaxID=2161747 RepID=UPI001E63622C|nr:signal peptidase II [Saccharospirillum mangrovi]